MKNFNIQSLSLKSIPLPFNLKLQPRERTAVTLAGIAVVLFLVFQVLILPVVDKRSNLAKEIKSKNIALEMMQTLKAEHAALTQYNRGADAQLKKRPKDFTLFSFIDKLAGQSGIKNNIVYMKPSTSNLKNSAYSLSKVEMKINSLTMEQLTTFLHGVEGTTRMVWIKRMSISKGDKNNGLINAILQVETFQL